MRGFFISILILVCVNANAKASEVHFKIYQTGFAKTQEAAVMEGGSLAKKVTLVHSAVLIQHQDQYVLFDTGLGSQIDKQFKDMPLFARPFFSYEKIQPLQQQLSADIQKRIHKIFLSHMHWDHASGLSDFPDACVATNTEERQVLSQASAVSTFPSQFRHQPQFCENQWQDQKIYSFEKSYDIFKDGSAILVPLPGHTKGSVGLFLRSRGKVFFFIGDLTWSRKALLEGKHKFFLASKMVDQDRDVIMKTLLQVKKLAEENKDVVIIPAHDREAQEGL